MEDTIEIRRGDWFLIAASVNAWNELYASAEGALRSRMDEILSEKRAEAFHAAIVLRFDEGIQAAINDRLSKGR